MLMKLKIEVAPPFGKKTYHSDRIISSDVWTIGTVRTGELLEEFGRANYCSSDV